MVGHESLFIYYTLLYVDLQIVSKLKIYRFFFQRGFEMDVINVQHFASYILCVFVLFIWF